MNIKMPRPGFTLVELLVVVAIFGILSSFGIIAYQIYITSAKDEVGISNANDMSRMLQIDHTAITTGITARSDLAEGLTTTNLCREQADKIVYEINTVQGKTNQHNADCGVAFNGNRAWSSVNHLDSVNNVDYFDGCPVTVSNDTIFVPRGRTMVACVNNTATIGSASFKIYTCHCSEDDECETTNVGDDCSSSPFLGYLDEDTCRANWMRHPDNRNKCASPGAFN